MIDKRDSRKWKITKAIFYTSNFIGITLLLFTYGTPDFKEIVLAVLAYLGTVNSLTAVAYNAANAYGKRCEE